MFAVYRICFLFAFLAVSARGDVTTIFYSSNTHNGGGVAELILDSSSGAVISHQWISEGLELSTAKKLAVTEDGNYLALTSEDDPSVLIYNLADREAEVLRVPMERETETVVAWRNSFVVCTPQGWFYLIDPLDGIISTWNSRDSLLPSGRKGEEILVLPDQDLALISFQKDSHGGRHEGSRLLVFDLEGFHVLHDLRLPRDRPDLHIPADPREMGPNPEMIFVSPATNTLVLSLDLYGGLAFADLDAAMNGEWSNLEYISSHLEGEWGTAFPDRGLLVHGEDTDYLLISNASENGGLIWVDVGSREILGRYPCATGTQHPVKIAATQQLATVPSGKIKSRTESGLDKTYEPGSELMLFDLSPLEAGEAPGLENIDLGAPLIRIVPLQPAHSSKVLLAAEQSSGNSWIIYDLETSETTDEFEALGEVSRIIVRYPDM